MENPPETAPFQGVPTAVIGHPAQGTLEIVDVDYRPIPAPLIDQQLLQAETGGRHGAVEHFPSLVSPNDERWNISDEAVAVTESELLQDLAGFLEHGARAAEQLGHTDMAVRARNARQNLTFIGHNEFDQATQGIADYWKSYLESDPHNVIVVFDSKQSRPYKSADFVTDAITHRLSEANPELSARIRLVDQDYSSLQSMNPDNVKIVVADDWISTGAMMKSDAKQVARELRRSGAGNFVDKIEANLLVARQDQLDGSLQFIDEGGGGNKRDLPIKAYYVSPPQDEAGMFVFGWYSSVDHNDSFLRQLALDIAKASGQDTRLPLAALVRRPYQ